MQQGGTGILRVVDPGKFLDAGIELLGGEQFRSRAIRPDRIVLCGAVGGHHIGRNANLVKAVAGANHTFGTDVPFIHDGDQIGTFGQNAFKAGVIVGQPVDGGVGFVEFWQDRAEPDRRPLDPVLLAQKIQDLGRGLPDGHGGLGGAIKGQTVAAIIDGQRIGCFCRQHGAPC